MALLYGMARGKALMDEPAAIVYKTSFVTPIFTPSQQFSEWLLKINE
jgi:hypothetical protein